jgi:trigger factor
LGRSFKLSYSIKSQDRLEKNKVALKVEVSDGYFNKSLNKAYKNISEKAKIPGFRKGKIPYEIIDLNYGKDYVLSEAANIAISNLYPEIIEDIDLKPIDYPKVDIDGEIVQNKPLNFLITVEVEPEAELSDYVGIEVEGFPVEVTDEEVDKQIENLRDKFAALEPIGETDVSKKGDIMTIDFVGTINGIEFEGGSSKDYVLEIGAGTLFKEIENALEGRKKGEEVKVNVKIPEEATDKDIAGKDAKFNINIKEIKRKVVPELNSEFLKDIGDFENIDSLRQFIRTNLEQQKKNLRRDKILSDIVDSLVKNSKIDIPDIMIENEIKSLKNNFEEELNSQKITKEQYLNYFNITEETFEENIKKEALINIKEYIIFNTLEKELNNKIEPTDDEIKAEKEDLINNLKKVEDKNKLKEYLDTPQGIKNVKSSVRRKKLIDFLIDNAKIKELSLEDIKKKTEEETAHSEIEEKESQKDEIKDIDKSKDKKG